MANEAESAHEFGALNTLLLVVILGLCIVSAYLIKQNSFYYLPESGAAIIVGLIVGGLTRVVYPSKEELNFLSFDPQLFFFLLLPPIIFEAGYSLKKKDFFANFWTISLFAVIGTVMATFVTGFLVYLVSLTGVIPLSDPLEGLLFGALISAVDPVATLSIMGNPELNCDPLLYSLVFGESVLNDAVAIVLFNTFRKYYDAGKEFQFDTFGSVMISFTLISLGSIFVGISTALICCYLCKQTHMRSYPEYEIAILFLFAYGSYALSEALELSGIMSIFFTSIILSYYNSANLSQTSQVTAHTIFKSLAVLCEFFVFLYMGMGFFTGKFKDWNFGFVFLAIVFCFIARFFNTIPMSFVANLWRKKKIPFPMQAVMWFSGLRGAMSFALSMNMGHENRDLYVSTTLCIIIFTTIFCGGLTEPVLSRMGMKKDENDSDDDQSVNNPYEALIPSPLLHDHESADIDGDDSSHINGNVSLATASPNTVSSGNASPRNGNRTSVTGSTISPGTTFWQRFDNNFMKPSFGGSSSETNLVDMSVKILELVSPKRPDNIDATKKVEKNDHINKRRIPTENNRRGPSGPL